jgi:hypothetical protein
VTTLSVTGTSEFRSTEQSHGDEHSDVCRRPGAVVEQDGRCEPSRGIRVANSSSNSVRVDTRVLSPRVPWRTRWRLNRAARLDRRAGLPVGLSAETTPILAELVAQFGYAGERERTSYLADEQHLTVQLRRLQAQLESLQETVRRRTQDVDRLTHATAGDWLSLRYPGEEGLSPAATQTRRAVAHRRALDAAEATRRQAQQEVDDVLVEIADVRARIHRRAEVARSHVVRHRELAHRKAAIYRRTLLRRHPERGALIDRWTTEICVLPDWATRIAPLPSESSSQSENGVFA